MNVSETYVMVRWNLDLTGSHYDRKIRSMQATDLWERRRLQIWSRYTMPSLLRQRFRDFRVLVLCDPRKPGQNARVSATFPDGRFEIVTDWPSRREAIRICWHSSDLITFCRIDSDDMYHRDAIHAFLESAPVPVRGGCSFIQAMKGCALDVGTGKVYRWKNPSPPFFAAVRLRADLADDFPDGPGIVNHSELAGRADPLEKDPLFCVTINGMNICNRIGVPWLGREIFGAEKIKVGKDYELNDTDDTAVRGCGKAETISDGLPRGDRALEPVGAGGDADNPDNAEEKHG